MSDRLSLTQRATLRAVADTVFPPGDSADPASPGGAALGADEYVLRALGGPYARYLDDYRSGLDALEAVARARHGQTFAALDLPSRSGLLREMEAGRLPGAPPEFFEVLCEHVLEGLWCDPRHGGNRGRRGWALIGYPGPRLSHDPSELAVRRLS